MPTGYDLTETANVLLGRLGATSWTDLPWLTEAEAFGFFDEAAKRLAERARLFADRDDTTAIAANQAQYDNPASWIDTEHVDLDGAALRPASAAELTALDATWAATPGPPARYSLDAGPLGTITVYPAPQADSAGKKLAQVYEGFPDAISTGQTVVPLPAALADYFLYFGLMRARGKESEGAMPGMAAHFEQRVKLYEQIALKYWGRGE